MRKIAVINGGSSFHNRTYRESKYREYITELIYLRELAHTDLTPYDVVIFPSQLHLGLVKKMAAKVREYADNGGIVVSFGPQPIEWFPGQNWEHRETNFWWWTKKGATSGLVLRNPEHELFDYITLNDATWHQHGVYWPPEGSDVLISTEDGGAVLYVDKVSTKGTWIVMTLDPDYHYGSYFMPATERFLDGLFPWLRDGNI